MRVLDEPGPYPDQEIPFTHELLGDMAAQAGEWSDAENQYRRVLNGWPGLGSTTGTVEISLADVLSRDAGRSRRIEAQSLLDAYLQRSGLQFQNILFRWHLVRIRLVAHDGDTATQQASAREALRLAQLRSYFPRHGDVGTVQTTPQVISELQQLAAD